MNFVSLFAGVGGFDLAFERAGMDCVGQVEIDAKCREVLHQHWPDVPRWEDVHDVTASRIQMAAGGRCRDVGDRNGNGPQSGNDSDASSLLLGGNVHGGTEPVDVLCGGFPCQDYSVAGKRGGLAGDRGALWWQFHRLIAECRPRWVVGENVPGLLSSNGGRDFGAIVGSLVELGYGVVWRVLDAQYFGVAQRRRRVFIVGHSGGIPRPEILALAEGCSGDTPPIRETGKGLAPTLASRTRGGGGLGTDTELDGALIAGTLETRTTWERQRPAPGHLVYNKSSMDAGWEPGVRTLRARDSKGDSHVVVGPLTSGSMGHTRGTETTDSGHVIAFDWTRGDQISEERSPTLRVGSGLGIPSGPAIFNPYRTMTQPGEYVEGFKPDEIHDALTANPAPKGPPLVVAPSVRRLTPLECERLQGFPDNWTAGQSDTQRYRQMGNAVAVPVVEWIGKQIVKAE